MSDFFKEFNKVSSSEWSAKLIADLKGKPEELLDVMDDVEEITIKGYQHSDNATSIEDPGAFPYTRGMARPNNDWKNGSFIIVDDEKAANEKALKKLMTGADLLLFKGSKSNTDWKTVLNAIQLQYINVQFEVSSYDDYLSISDLTKDFADNVQFNFDFMLAGSDLLQKIATNHQKEKQQAFCLVDGFEVQQAGATTWQEIAFSLNVGHEYLLQLMDAGLSIDQAAACITFRLGVGANYLFEIAKFRVFKSLWSKVIAAYNPEHDCTYNARITAMTGHLNKSLQDPYTNLLRQTTEAMSALAGGVDNIIVLPYDFHAEEENSELSERMAMNIPLILKEESYFDKVIDPVGGSYNLEVLASQIKSKAWGNFQKIESEGGLFNASALSNFVSEVKEKAAVRTEKFAKGERILIGVNKFPNPDESNLKWTSQPAYLGMEKLILESSKNIAAV